MIRLLKELCFLTRESYNSLQKAEHCQNAAPSKAKQCFCQYIYCMYKSFELDPFTILSQIPFLRFPSHSSLSSFLWNKRRGIKRTDAEMMLLICHTCVFQCVWIYVCEVRALMLQSLHVFNRTTGGESQGGATEGSGCPGRHLEAEEGLFLPEPDRASLHGSEGLLNILSTRFKRSFRKGLKLLSADSGKHQHF